MNEQWPKLDASVLMDSKVEIIVQINGKLRSKVSVDYNETESVVTKKAYACENVTKYLNKGEVKKVIFIKNKLINFVI